LQARKEQIAGRNGFRPAMGKVDITLFPELQPIAPRSQKRHRLPFEVAEELFREIRVEDTLQDATKLWKLGVCA
jgi:hypothetical protein